MSIFDQLGFWLLLGYLVGIGHVLLQLWANDYWNRR